MKRINKDVATLMIVIIFLTSCLFDGNNQYMRKWAGKMIFPGLTYLDKQDEVDLVERIVDNVFPLYHYVGTYVNTNAEVEDSLTYEMLLSIQAADEDKISEDLLDKNEPVKETVGLDMSLEKLRDFNYLVSNFYTVDSTTTISANQLNIDDLLSRNMKIDKTKKGPKVLIFHTHSQETFVDSIPGDSSTSIVGMGAYLAERLNAMGIETIHHDGVYDLINGELDRSKAYEMAGVAIKEILNQYPSIEVVIDLHRDGVKEGMHLVTEIDGKQVAKIMFFNGLSRTKTNGDLTSLPNPYIQDNLSFSFQMQMASESLYPTLARRIYLKGYRYNLHLMPKSLLIEAGAQTNSVEEVKNAMDLLAILLGEVLL